MRHFLSREELRRRNSLCHTKSGYGLDQSRSYEDAYFVSYNNKIQHYNEMDSWIESTKDPS